MTALDLEIPPFLDRRPKKPLVYTFTMLAAYRNCGHAMFRRYVKKDIPYVETEAMRYGNEVHRAFELRVGRQVRLPSDMTNFEKFAAPFDGRGALVELKLAMNNAGRMTGYWDADCWFRGKVDTAVINKNKAYIRDWKTGNSKYEDPFELECNALLLKTKYPELEAVRGDYCYVKEDRIGQSYDLSRFGSTWAEINRLVALIEANRAQGAFKKRQSGLCGWCDVRDCEHNRKGQ